jgi:uncharacterized protein (DUF983 family)
MTIVCLLVIAAFIGVLASAFGRLPLWVPVLILCIAELLGCMPLR